MKARSGDLMFYTSKIQILCKSQLNNLKIGECCIMNLGCSNDFYD